MGPRQKSIILRGEIRRLLRLKLRYDEIMQKLNLPRSTFFRHLEVIREEDRKWLIDLARNDFLSSYRMALDFIEDQVRALIIIREQAQKPRDKIEATRAIVEVEEVIMELLALGPTVVKLDRMGTNSQGASINPDKNLFDSFLSR